MNWTARRIWLLAFALLVGVGWTYDTAHPVDDAFITFRYASNLIHGHGLVFNLGERIEGYTSFGWLLATAPLTLFGKAWTPRLAVLLGLAAWAGVVALAWALMRRERGETPLGLPDWFVLLFLPLCSPAMFWSWSGMETAAFALAWIAAFTLHLREVEDDRLPWRSGALTFAAGLLHPEGVLLGVGLGAGWLWPFSRGRAKRAAQYLAIAWGLFGVYWLCRWAYFGDFVPNTFNVKVGSGGALVKSGLYYVVQSGISTVVPLVMFYLLFRERAGFRAWPRWLWTALGLIAILVAYNIKVGGDYFPYQRFLLPALPFTLLVVWRLWRDRRAAADKPEKKPPWAWALAMVAGLNLWSAVYPNFQFKQHEIFQVIVPEFAASGRMAGAKMPHEMTVATIAIGAFGYNSDLRILDLLGLVDAHIGKLPIATGQRVVGHEKYDYDYVMRRRPEAIMQLPALFTEDWAGLKEWLSKTTLNRYEYSLYDQPALYTDYELAFLPSAWAERRSPTGRRLEQWFTKPFFGATVAKTTLRGAYAWVRKDVLAIPVHEGWKRLPPEMAAFPLERHEDYIQTNRRLLGGRRLGMWKFGAE